jgi:type VI secretion system secreted protein Hcp
MPIYMKYGDVKGNVTSGDHKDWIEVHSCQYGVGRPMTMAGGAGTNRECGAHPNLSEISISKINDDSSQQLHNEALCGEGVPVTIRFCQSSKAGALQPYLELTLDKVMISGFSMGSGGDRPSESLSLNFTKIVYKYTKFSGENKVGSPATSGYDLETQKVC